MWTVELNVVGYQFTHQLPDRRANAFRLLRLSRRNLPWCGPALNDTHAA